MTLKEEVKILKELKFDEVRKHTKISVRLECNKNTILKTTLTIENAILLFGNYEVKLIQLIVMGNSPFIEFVCLVPEEE